MVEVPPSQNTICGASEGSDCCLMFSDSNRGTLYEAIPCIAILQRPRVAKQLTDLKGNYLDINSRVDESLCHRLSRTREMCQRSRA